MSLRDDPNELLSRLFHHNSKVERHDHRFAQKVSSFLTNPQIQHATSRPFKRYSGASVSALPSPLEGPSNSLTELLATRRSATGAFVAGGASLAQLSRVLWSGSGVVSARRTPPSGAWMQLRNTPSAGGLYPLEVYFVSFSVDGLEAGLYHYAAADHSLECLELGNLEPTLSSSCLVDLSHAAGVVVLSALFRRSQAKYGERGYRFALLEAGHLAQNVLLSATAEGLSTRPLGGFIDDEVTELLGLDGYEESPLYLLALGRSS